MGSYRLTPPPGSALPQPPELTCVDAGPDTSTPVLLACGTAGGALVLVGLPLVHFIRELESANTFAAALLQSLPVKLVKDTVNMAFNTFGRVRARMVDGGWWWLRRGWMDRCCWFSFAQHIHF